MKILHVVTLVTPDGELGGPLRVALIQLRELMRRGHEVLLVAGARGFEGELPREFHGVPVKLFPAVQVLPGAGFAGVSAPTMAPWLLANLSRFDAVHLHFARDLVLVPAAAAVLAARRKYVAQTHGMVVPNSKKSAKILDSVVVRRALSRADVVYALVETERAELLKVEPKAQVEVLPNGLDFDEPRPQANPAEKTDVLYLARLAPRKRPMDFVQAAKLLAADFPEWTFSLVGPDEGEVEAINRVLAADPALARRVRWEGPLAPDQTAGRMAQAGVYVLPAEREPFGMTIIEAQAVGLPVVMRSDCGIAPGIVNADAGVAYDGGAEELAAALRPLLSSPEARTSLGERAQQYVRSAFGVSSVVDRLERRYRS